MRCDCLAIIEEFSQLAIAGSGKPSCDFGKGGATPALTWLNTQGRPSNKVGVPFGLNNGKLIEVWVGNEILTQFDVGVYYHYGDEVGLTLLKTLTVPNTARTKTFDLSDIGDVNVPKDVQIGFRILTVPGTIPQNTGSYVIIRGTK
jgi:hypothetical protein